MKKAKLYLMVIAAAAAITFWNCSSPGERAAVEETAQQIEDAHLAGRDAGRMLLNRQFKDSLELQGQLVKAGVARARYDSLPKSRAAFDSAFISTVRTVNPALAGELERNRP